jgi:hypothetical protein
MRTNAIVLALLFVGGCGSKATDPGQGDLVATLPAGTFPMAMFGDDSILHIMTGDTAVDAAAQEIAFARVDVGSGSVQNATLPSNINWSDFAESSPTLPLGSDIAEGSADEAFVMGLQGVTTVPFDGGLSELLTLPDDAESPGAGTLEGFNVESDGTVTAVYCVAARTVAGSLSGEGVWTELGMADDTCWPTQVLSDADAVYFASEYSLWRIDRQSHEARILYYLPDNGGTILMLAQTSDSIAMMLPTFADGATSAFELAKVPKAGGPPATILSIDPNSPMVTGMMADDQSIYYVTSRELDRISLATGSVDVLAKRGAQGAFLLPVLGSTNVYFIDLDEDSTGNAMTSVVRSVTK